MPREAIHACCWFCCLALFVDATATACLRGQAACELSERKHFVQSPDKLRKIQEEISTLKDVLVDRLESGVAALEGGFSSVTGHLWFSEDEGAALATALQPKLHKAQESVSTTLFELVTLELAIERDVDAVVLANLMPRYWADFIRSSSDKEAREMGTVPTA